MYKLWSLFSLYTIIGAVIGTGAAILVNRYGSVLYNQTASIMLFMLFIFCGFLVIRIIKGIVKNDKL